MEEQSPDPPQRSYGCSWGCGNPYDFVFVSVTDATTEFLCLPCMVHLASDMVRAATELADPTVEQAVYGAGRVDQAPMRGPGPGPRGKNAPAGTDDPDLLEAFTGIITEEELPDEFR